ncbi:hypothetical protein H2200_003597 [Cladophialophora chaetospira]|uniref:NAD(P)-binding protein n=1 Tax=Cladophialophora chaetospira TaxID=386627 RepID=A0AA38XEN3_9EURO|nr:hypothetical protein H2200_003597 [Cladophialophora chaetospira]
MSSIFQVPREGITLEFLFRPVHHILLQPLIPAILLAISYRNPKDFESAVSTIAKDIVRPGTVSLFLKVLLAFSTLYRLDTYLSRRVLNNWVTDSTWDWKREVVLVTGGCSGIGKEIVQLFSEKNILTVVIDVNPPKHQKVAAKIRKEIGEPTVLINNAGVATMKLILDETEEQVQRTFEVNISAHFKMVKEFLPHMIKTNHGHIVTTASIASYATWASNTSYSATKAAVLAFHEGLAQELRARYNANKVRTTVVQPVTARTPPSDPIVKGLESRQFLLDPGTVAEAVVNQVLKGEGAQLILPTRYGFVSSMRAWPSWMQENARSEGANEIQNPN